MSRFSEFTPSNSNVITLHTMDQLNADVENRINDAIDALSEDLYPTIAAAARNFDVPT